MHLFVLKVSLAVILSYNPANWLLTTEILAELENVRQSVDLHEDDAPYSAVQTVNEDGRVILRPRPGVPIVQDTHEAFDIGVNADFGPKDRSATVENDSGKPYHLANRLFANILLEHEHMHQDVDPHEDVRDTASYSTVQAVEEDGRVIVRPSMLPFPIVQPTQETFEIHFDSVKHLDVSNFSKCESGKLYHPVSQFFAKGILSELHRSVDLPKEDGGAVPYSAVQTVNEDGRVILRPPPAVPIVQDIHEPLEISVNPDVRPKEWSPMVESDSGKP